MTSPKEAGAGECALAGKRGGGAEMTLSLGEFVKRLADDDAWRIHLEIIRWPILPVRPKPGKVIARRPASHGNEAFQ
jgi:hypothetical protein